MNELAVLQMSITIFLAGGFVVSREIPYLRDPQHPAIFFWLALCFFITARTSSLSRGRVRASVIVAGGAAASALHIFPFISPYMMCAGVILVFIVFLGNEPIESDFSYPFALTFAFIEWTGVFLLFSKQSIVPALSASFVIALVMMFRSILYSYRRKREVSRR